MQENKPTMHIRYINGKLFMYAYGTDEEAEAMLNAGTGCVTPEDAKRAWANAQRKKGRNDG